MRKIIAIIHYEYKMQVQRPATWGVLLAAIMVTLSDNYPSARNLARLEFLDDPAYFVYRTEPEWPYPDVRLNVPVGRAFSAGS